ncbi:MAG: zinc-binding dehydrogenase [Mogibacterium sp.]|nr:zinc-binding dehydrogenase [Mogibacterium sp.]
MLNTVYRLVEPRRIEAEFCDIDVNGEEVLVRPTFLSICNADQRYFQGTRPPEVLKKKLPMALIHEAIGVVMYDPKGEFKPGQKVAMVPNTPFEEDDIIAENYLRSSKFRASGFDGFMQDIVALRRDRAILLPEGIDDHVAAFTELVSVSYHTIDRFDRKAHARRNVLGVWGDGNLAFITSLLLKKRFPESKVCIFGKHEYKMNDFVFADECYHINEIPADLRIDHGFECVGKAGSGTSINQIIDYIHPEGCIAAMGVSEENVPINTRMILEKGLTLFGSSRSSAEDFRNLLAFYREHPEVVEYLSSIIGEIVEVRTIKDMVYAFDADIQKRGGKTVMVWKK